MDIATNDTEIAAAINAWINAGSTVWPSGIVVRFHYDDGTRGTVAWSSDSTIGPAFAYNLRNATHAVGFMFTPEMFNDSAFPILPFLHAECRRMLERVTSHANTA